MRASRWWLLSWCVVASACKPATQVIFEIKTRLPCDQRGTGYLAVGLSGEVENAPPARVIEACDDDNLLIGTYTVTPVGDRPRPVSFKVTLAVRDIDGRLVNGETDCTRSLGYAGCIVARRQVSFVRNQTIRVPVELYDACRGIACDQDSTCRASGRCGSSRVDPMRCSAEGECTELETNPTDGFSCAGGALTCPDWCVQKTPGGATTCSADPGDAGVAWQCRAQRDCASPLVCAPGQGSILGQCVPAAQVRDTVICRPDEVPSSCAGGLSACTADAGAGLLSCPFQCPSASQRMCGGQCVECPLTGDVRDTRCASTGAQCLVASCRTGFALVDGGCQFVPAYAQTLALKNQPSAVALSGDGKTMALSFNGEDAGVVRVFNWQNGAWVPSALVTSDAPVFGDGFGTSVAFSHDGTTLVVGANQENDCAVTQADASVQYVKCAADGGPGAALRHNGSLYVFTLMNGQWRQQARLIRPQPQNDDIFGTGVWTSVDGTVALSAATYADNGATLDVGRVHVFALSGGTWQHASELRAPVERALQRIGSIAASASGDLVAVGSPADPSNATGANGDAANTSAPRSGAVLLFSRDGGSWAPAGYLKPGLTFAESAFGGSVSMSADGRTLVVGAPFEAGAGQGVAADPAQQGAVQSGAVYVFTGDGAGGWSQSAYLKASNARAAAQFGWAVALSADAGVLLVSAPGEASARPGPTTEPLATDDGEPRSGAVYRFEHRAAGWLQTGFVKAPRPQKDDAFGSQLSASASADAVAATSLTADSFDGGPSVPNSGAAFFYRFQFAP